MKKIFLGLFFLTLLGIIISPLRGLFKEEATQISKVEPSVKEILPESATKKVEDVQEKVLKKIFKEKASQKEAQFLLDSETTSDFYLEKAGIVPAKAKEFLRDGFSELKSCLHEGCGQGPDDDGFYDPANTVAVSVMIRILEVADINSEELSTKEWLEKDDLLDLLKSPNQKLRRLALKNLFKNYPSQSVSETLSSMQELEGYEAGDAIEGLIPYLTPENRESFVGTIKDIIKKGEVFTITEVLEKSEKAELESSHIEDISKELCHYKTPEGETAFKAMNFSINTMASNNGFQFQLDKFCR